MSYQRLYWDHAVYTAPMVLSGIGWGMVLPLLSSSSLQRVDFNAAYLSHSSLTLLTAALCLPVNTSPAAVAKRTRAGPEPKHSASRSFH